jgi:hypothetical protein
MTGLRYCLVIACHLYQRSVGHGLAERGIVVLQHCGGGPLECGQLVIADIVLLVLGEAVDEETMRTDTKQNDRSKPTRFAASRPGDALFQDEAAQIGLDQAAHDIVDCHRKHRVGQPGLSGEPGERIRLEYRHTPAPLASGLIDDVYNTGCDSFQDIGATLGEV